CLLDAQPAGSRSSRAVFGLSMDTPTGSRGPEAHSAPRRNRQPLAKEWSDGLGFWRCRYGPRADGGDSKRRNPRTADEIAGVHRRQFTDSEGGGYRPAVLLCYAQPWEL